MVRAEIRAALLLLVACLLPVTAGAASRYDPALRFRVLGTPHFVVYFHQGEDALARRFAALAEQVHGELTRRLLTAPRGRTHVILVDQHDRANGWATPLPYNTIEISVSPPAPREVIGNTHDWLRLVFTHEYTHILHLDRSRGFASAVRAIFGRAPLAFPNLFLPPWQTEGLATYEESAVTGRGRVNAGDFALFVRQAARQDRAWALDRASSDFDNWPAGNAPYAYGAFFNDYLAKRYGEESLARLAARTSGRFYFLSSGAFKSVYGKSLGTLWREFTTAQAELAPAGSSDAGRRLTHQGFVVAGPRFVPGDSKARLLYSSRTSRDFPALMSVDMQGRSRRLTSRYYGDQVSVAGQAALFDQQDLARSVAMRSDLYKMDLSTRRVQRLTHGARLLDPAIAPGGRALAAVALRDGSRTLVLFDLPGGAWPNDVAALRKALSIAPRVVASESGTHFSAPAWSPDGRWLAAERRRDADGAHDIAIVEPATGRVVGVAAGGSARYVTPVWTPDGRSLLFASDRPPARDTQSHPEVPRPFNLYAVDLTVGPEGVRPSATFRVTDLSTGATSPDVAAGEDGRPSQIAYVGYTAEGYDLFVLPFDRSRWTPVDPQVAEPDQRPTTTDQRPTTTTTDERPPTTNQRPYHPYPTLLPRFWSPVFEVENSQFKVGAQTAGSDVLGRHWYAVDVLARVAGSAAPGSRRYDWAASYIYDRWVPAFFAAASDRTRFLRHSFVGGGRTVPMDLREQNEEVGVVVPDAHVRYGQAVAASLVLQRQTINAGGLAQTRIDRNALRLSWSLDSTHTYPYSISREQGVAIGLTGELVRRGLGAIGNADAMTLDARGYLRLGGRHAILALRGAFGASRGDAQAARHFFLGGPGPNGGTASFGSDALNLLRGFAQNEFAGFKLGVVNVEYRVPLLRVERGIGTWPAFLRTLQATLFVDAGKTWTNAFADMPLAHSLGAELSGSFRLGYELPITAAAGVAWPRGPLGATRGATGYVRAGYGF